jgi:hypothetical protein
MEHGDDEAWVQLATRIPKPLHRKLRLHCVTTEITLTDFVTMALREKLAGSGGAPADVSGKRSRRSSRGRRR